MFSAFPFRFLNAFMFGILYACTYIIGLACVLVRVCVCLHDSIKQLQEMLFMWCLYDKPYDHHVIGNET